MNKQPSYTPNENKSLQIIAKGSIIIFFGIITGILFGAIGNILFARYFSPSEYGVFSLGIALLSICAIFGTLGLIEGTTREIAYYTGKNRHDDIQSIIIWSLIFGIISGIILFLVVFFCSDIIAKEIFNISLFSSTLRTLSVAIPFYILILIISSIFRGFKRVKEKVIFVDLIKNLLFLLLLVPVIIFGFPFNWGISAYTFSIVISGIVFIIYFIIKIPNILKIQLNNQSRLIGKKLLFFSLPLMFVMILSQIILWTDTMMLGYFKTPESVGFYNAAIHLARFIATGLSAIVFIYTPFIAYLYAREKYNEIKRSYTILTKWLCAATLPITSVFVLFPNLVLNFFFGSNYIFASTVLQILAIGLFINNLLGPNGAILTALGRTKFLMVATIVAAIINVFLNVLLIPIYGMIGAAIASIITLVSINIIRSLKIYSSNKIHSMQKNILKSIILYTFLIILFYFLSRIFLTIELWMLPIILILFIMIYAISLLFTKSYDREDIEALLYIEKKSGLNLSKIIKLIEKFI